MQVFGGENSSLVLQYIRSSVDKNASFDSNGYLHFSIKCGKRRIFRRPVKFMITPDGYMTYRFPGFSTNYAKGIYNIELVKTTIKGIEEVVGTKIVISPLIESRFFDYQR